MLSAEYCNTKIFTLHVYSHMFVHMFPLQTSSLKFQGVGMFELQATLAATQATLYAPVSPQS